MGLRGPKPGSQRRGGRKKGTPNKISTKLKNAIENAFAALGGEDYLVKIAEEDPRTFCALLGKILPMQGEAQADQPIRRTIITGVPRPGDDNGEISYTIMPDGQIVWPSEN